MAETAGESSADLTRFIEEYFGYLLPWGISGYLHIAQTVAGAEQLSQVAGGLPSLVKYGVPTLEAAWAMGLGVASRQTALRVAEVYGRTGGDSDPRALRRWLAGLDPEELAESLGIAGVELEATARVLVRSRRSAILAEIESGEPLLPRSVRIRQSPRVPPAIASGIQPGQVLRLARDYMSGINRNATAVMVEGRRLGYLPYDIAIALGPELDAGMEAQAIVEGTTSEDGLALIDLRLEEVPG